MGAVEQLNNRFLRGVGASPGVVTGKAFLLDRSKVRLPEKRIEADQVEAEVERFLQAIRESREQLTEIKDKSSGSRSAPTRLHP